MISGRARSPRGLSRLHRFDRSGSELRLADRASQLHDDLPVFLLLVDRDDGALLAACKLSRVGSVSLPVGGDLAVPSEPDRCVLLENVIVDRAKRRGGLGRRLMAAMERFAAS